MSLGNQFQQWWGQEPNSNGLRKKVLESQKVWWRERHFKLNLGKGMVSGPWNTYTIFVMIKLNDEYKAFDPVDIQYLVKMISHYYYYYCSYWYHSFVDDNHWFGEIRISYVLCVWCLCWLNETSRACGLKGWNGEILMGKVAIEVTSLLENILLLFCYFCC